MARNVVSGLHWDQFGQGDFNHPRARSWRHKSRKTSRFSRAGPPRATGNTTCSGGAAPEAGPRSFTRRRSPSRPPHVPGGVLGRLLFGHSPCVGSSRGRGGSCSARGLPSPSEDRKCIDGTDTAIAKACVRGVCDGRRTASSSAGRTSVSTRSRSVPKATRPLRSLYCASTWARRDRVTLHRLIQREDVASRFRIRANVPGAARSHSGPSSLARGSPGIFHGASAARNRSSAKLVLEPPIARRRTGSAPPVNKSTRKIHPPRSLMCTKRRRRSVVDLPADLARGWDPPS